MDCNYRIISFEDENKYYPMYKKLHTKKDKYTDNHTVYRWEYLYDSARNVMSFDTYEEALNECIRYAKNNDRIIVVAELAINGNGNIIHEDKIPQWQYKNDKI